MLKYKIPQIVTLTQNSSDCYVDPKSFLNISIKKSCTLRRYSFFYVIPLRFERKTHALEGRCSIQLSYGTILNCECKGTVFIEITKRIRNFFALTIYFFSIQHPSKR